MPCLPVNPTFFLQERQRFFFFLPSLGPSESPGWVEDVAEAVAEDVSRLSSATDVLALAHAPRDSESSFWKLNQEFEYVTCK